MASPKPRFRGEDAVRDLDAVLRTMKREGCHLLVTGEVDARVADRATRRLFGDPNYDRKRVLAAPDSSTHVDRYLPVDVSPTDPAVWVVDPTGRERSIPPSAEDRTLPDADGDGSDLDRLRQELVQAVTFYADAGDGLAPAELQVGVASADALLERDDRHAVEQFLRTLGALVRGVDGMGHVRVALPDDHPTVASLSPLFDARIELRRRDGLVPEQRWHVPDRDVTTAWTQL
ncbi:DUF7504 family protein [Halomicrococcus sp. NG-SE-24]|uniref:DUF7504 family protein n=1 Tax=Halomicrococcus sp. NG-SE-24 TaxID=3436928 RepID=UPI003D980AFC